MTITEDKARKPGDRLKSKRWTPSAAHTFKECSVGIRFPLPSDCLVVKLKKAVPEYTHNAPRILAIICLTNDAVPGLSKTAFRNLPTLRFLRCHKSSIDMRVVTSNARNGRILGAFSPKGDLYFMPMATVQSVQREEKMRATSETKFEALPRHGSDPLMLAELGR